MCGITGIWSATQDQNHNLSEVRKAVALLRHRGPDDEGVWSNESGLALGHTRLSILDLSELGHQPMLSKDGRLTMVFNGEIYNYREIRKQLEGDGHRFSGTGDTEVILAAFREWGPEAVQQFIGMFAIALWDAHSQTLHLFRDRLGVKPLYFSLYGRTFCFGSELKSIKAYRHWSPRINQQALGEFLQYGYVADTRTIFDNVYKLKPGHHLSLKTGQQPVISSYWSALDHIDNQRAGSDREIESALEELLLDSFQYRMLADVPVGVYLSGGIDSSLVTALLAKHHEQEIRTFTIGFGEDQHDESKWAAQVAAHCGTKHKEYILGVGEALNIARDWGRLFDEPFGDSSGIPTLLVSRLASEEVKVVLSADGGDELFSGYNVYSSILNRLRQLQRIPGWSKTGLSNIMSLFLPNTSSERSAAKLIPAASRGTSTRRLERFAAMLRNPTAGHLMETYVSYWQPAQIDRLIGRYTSPRPSADSYPGMPATQISLWDIHHYLPEDILTKVDRTTMAVSIEGREPLLDHRIAEFALSLPPHMRRGELGPKHVLKSILYRYVPRHLVDRPKQGFAIPLTTWLQNDLKELATDYLSDNRIRDAGLMDASMVSNVVKNFYGGNETLSTPMWFLLAFEMWREHWG